MLSNACEAKDKAAPLKPQRTSKHVGSRACCCALTPNGHSTAAPPRTRHYLWFAFTDAANDPEEPWGSLIFFLFFFATREQRRDARKRNAPGTCSAA